MKVNSGNMLRAHAWNNEIQGLIIEVKCVVAENKAKISKMLRGLELTAKFLDDNFENRVATLRLPSS